MNRSSKQSTSIGQRPVPKPAAPGGNRFKQTLFGCCSDPALACSLLFCSCTATGQLYARVTKYPQSCCLIAVGLWAVFCITSVLNGIQNGLAVDADVRKSEHEDRQEAQLLTQLLTQPGSGEGVLEEEEWVNPHRTAMIVLAYAGGTVGFLGTVLSTIALCVARREQRKRDGIDPQLCGECEDCCVSYWCGYCTLAQGFAQEGITGANYNPLTANAV